MNTYARYNFSQWCMNMLFHIRNLRLWQFYTMELSYCKHTNIEIYMMYALKSCSYDEIFYSNEWIMWKMQYMKIGIWRIYICSTYGLSGGVVLFRGSSLLWWFMISVVTNKTTWNIKKTSIKSDLEYKKFLNLKIEWRLTNRLARSALW